MIVFKETCWLGRNIEDYICHPLLNSLQICKFEILSIADEGNEEYEKQT